jgi:hypothetical protein
MGIRARIEDYLGVVIARRIGTEIFVIFDLISWDILYDLWQLLGFGSSMYIA